MAVSHWAEVIESNVNVANNTSTVTLRVHLVTSGESYNYNEQLGNTYIYTPGENKFWRRYTLPPNTDTKIDSVIEGVAHNNDGSKTITWSYSLPTGISAGTVTGSGTATLTKIPRKTSITSFTVDKVSETTLKFNWKTADTVDYAWYSTNNGSTWTSIDVTDGTSGNFNVGNLSPGQSYNCKIKVRRKDSQLESDPSPTVAQSTYAAPTQSYVSKTETSITMKWSLDTTADYIWYSINNGSSYTAVGSVNATSGTYTISGLTADQTCNIKTKVRRKSSQTTPETSNLAVKTYNYPYVKSVSSNPLTIGNAQTLTIYNPLGRTATVYMKKTNTSGTTLYSGTTSVKGESATITFTPVASTLYASIPNNQDATCVYYCTYSNHTVSTKSGTYKVKGTEVPTFTNFTFADTTKTAFTGNNQVLVQGLSNLRVTIPVADKMVIPELYGSDGGNYTASCDTRTTKNPVPYSANADVNIDLGTIVTSGDKTITVTAYDTRQLYKPVQKTVTVIPYAKPTISVTATRLNNFENQTTLKVNGIYNLVKVSNVEKNSITSVKYRYREVGTQNWTALTDFTFTTSANTDTTKKYTCTDVTLDLDNTKSFEIEIQTLDGAGQTTITTATVNVGKAAFFIKKAGGFESNGASIVNNQLTVTRKTISEQGTNVKLINNSSSTGYMYVCRFTITNSYQDQYIIFHVIQRYRHGNIYLRFGGASSTDPSLGSINHTGNIEAHIVKSDTSTWDLYIKKQERYDNIDITQLEKGLYESGVTITWKSATVSTLPEGATASTLLTYNIKASNATSADSATSATTATNATNTALTTTNPTSETAYHLPFVTAGSGNLPLRANNGIVYITKEGTTSANGYGILRLGNGTASGTAGNKRGYLRIYANTAYYSQLQTADGVSANRTIYMPNHNGTIQVRPTELYNNTSGTGSTITLSQTAANFNYLEIFFKFKNGTSYSSTRVQAPNGKRAGLVAEHSPATNSIQLHTASVSISKTTVKFEAGKSIAINSSGGVVGYSNSNEIYIYKILGWL